MKGRVWIREQLVGEYLRGESTYREIEREYGISKSTLQRWVKAARRDKVEKQKNTPRNDEAGTAVETPIEAHEPSELSESEAAAEIKRLKRELQKAELHAEVLNAMIDIAKEDLGIDIRKKHGLKR